MNPKGSNFLSSLKIYFRLKKREALTHSTTGFGFSFLLYEMAHEVHFLHTSSFVEVCLFSVLGLGPLLLDFLHFWRRSQDVVFRALLELEEVLKKAMKSETTDIDKILKFKIEELSKSINIGLPSYSNLTKKFYDIVTDLNTIEPSLIRVLQRKNGLEENYLHSLIKKEIESLKKIELNESVLTIRHHFDYLRSVLKRTLEKVMRAGDHYITLASIDFWTIPEFDPIDFLKANLKVANAGSKFIHRIVILDEKYLSPDNLEDEDLRKFKDLVKLVYKMKELNIDCKYQANFKMLFYFHRNYDVIKPYLDSIFVLNKSLDEMMFIKVNRLEKISTDKPSVDIEFFKFEQSKDLQYEGYDTISLLNHICACFKIHSGMEIEEAKRFTDMNDYLIKFKKTFEEIKSVYNLTTGRKRVGKDKLNLFDTDSLYKEYSKHKIYGTAKKPQPEPNGFVVTLNQQGYMTSTVDKYMRAFIDFASHSKLPCVDIGAAYGVASMAVLQAGGTVIANDIDMRHLEILRDAVPKKLQSKLSLDDSRFPDTMTFKDDSIGAFLIARVAHFLEPRELIEGAKKLYKWLAPGGKVFLTGETPYLNIWKEFIPIYEKKKLQGDLWAGQLEDVQKYAPERGESLPKRMLLMDLEMLRDVFEKANFVIEDLNFFARPEFPDDIKLDNRESIGLICYKPR
ncbi:MAG: methyltransferase domain-containing protein [Ignavibacteria bacterium]